jgi:hypothetical protein
VRDTPPTGVIMEIDDTAADLELPMERPLFSPSIKPVITDVALESGADDTSEATLQTLYAQVVIDKPQLVRQVRHALQDRTQVTLREVCALHPLQHGLAELVAYLQLASDTLTSIVDEDASEPIVWNRIGDDGQVLYKQAILPRVIFLR